MLFFFKLQKTCSVARYLIVTLTTPSVFQVKKLQKDIQQLLSTLEVLEDIKHWSDDEELMDSDFLHLKIHNGLRASVCAAQASQYVVVMW